MRYRAFISYSHGASRKLAPALQSGLHRFARPWYKLRALTVFRDDTDLSVSPDLWSEIERALRASETLFLLTSPDAAQSKWVAREVEFWLADRSPDSLMLIQTEGEVVWSESAGDFDWEVTNALPRGLEGVFEREPFVPDLRWAREEADLSLDNPRFRDAIATLAARLHGRPKNELIGDDVREHRRAMRLAWSGVATLAVLLVAAVVAAFVALQQRDEAVRQSQIALVRQLNAQAELARQRELDQLPLSTLLALESMQRLPTPGSHETLRANLGLLPRKLASFPVDYDLYPPEFSPDGEFFLVRGGDDRLSLRDGRTGEVRGQWEAPNAVEVRINRDQTHFAVLEADTASFAPEKDNDDETHYALVREIRSGEIVARVPYQRGMRGYSLSPAARYLAFSRMDELRLWDLAADEQGHRFVHGGGIQGYDFSPSGELVAVTTTRGFHLWSLVDGRERIREESGESPDAAFRADGNVVAFAVTEDRTIRFYDTQSGDLITSFTTSGVPKRLEFSPAGEVIAIKGGDGSVSLWDLAELRERLRIQLARADDTLLGFSEDGALFATSGRAATQIWTAETGREVARIPEELDQPVTSLAWGAAGIRISVATRDAVSIFEPLPGPFVHAALHGHHVRTLSLSPDGSLMASGGWDKTVRVWNIEKGEEYALLFHRNSVEETAFTPDGRSLISATSDGTFSFWDVGFESATRITGEDGSSVRYLKSEDAWLRYELGGEPRDLALSPDGRLLATSSKETGLRIWSIGQQQELPTPAIEGEVYGVSFDPTGRRLATAEGARRGVGEEEDRDQNLARVWNGSTGEELLRLPHEHAVGLVTFSPDGRILATANRSTVWIWDAASGERLHELVHERPVNAVAFDPDGKHVLTATGPSVVRAGPHLVAIWDLETGRELARIDHSMAVTDVAVSPDGRYIASASMDRRAYLWLWKPEDLVREACGRLTRNLAPEEWERYLGTDPYRATCPELAK